MPTPTPDASPATCAAAAPLQGRQLPPGTTFRDPLRSGGFGPEMVVIPAGVFHMGCLSNDGYCSVWEKPVREVCIAQTFALAVHETTFEAYDRFTHPEQVADQGWGRGRRPVINVSWNDAHAYAVWLSEQTGAYYRLPTEAEWEYAARAGSSTRYSWGDDIGMNRANCHGCGSRYPPGAAAGTPVPWDFERTTPVGSFAANAFGLYDMHGNVREWVQDCSDWRTQGYAGAPSDGDAWLPGDCTSRRMRGGSWEYHASAARAASRSHGPLHARGPDYGFRVARTLTR